MIEEGYKIKQIIPNFDKNLYVLNSKTREGHSIIAFALISYDDDEEDCNEIHPLIARHEILKVPDFDYEFSR